MILSLRWVKTVNIGTVYGFGPYEKVLKMKN